MVRRIFVEKKPEFAVEAESLRHDLRQNLKIEGLETVRVVNRYDLDGMSDSEYEAARWTVLAEAPVDMVYDETLPHPATARVLAIEFLPGQYDQRADSAAQCIQILTQKERPEVRTARVLIMEGRISDEEWRRIKAYCINPVECREAGLEKPETLVEAAPQPEDVAVVEGFVRMSSAEVAKLWKSLGLAMSVADLEFCQTYFRDTEHRDPTITEIRVLDTYWSDHCRHTTFLTCLEEVDFEHGPYAETWREIYQSYQTARRELDPEAKKDLCLMDLATAAAREFRRQGLLDDLELSEEVNACSIKAKAVVNGQEEDWLVMFKNETHNHPTEIEPFGGAATCLGGAIRDPLSGRAYVYQALRVTGSGNPLTPIEATLPGKLPQRKITTGAAAGFSSYGNQVGLATGQVAEIYDPGYVAKRMEIGAVIAAAPQKNVRRESPVTGDVVILLGGRTGRDGCGGATGSSKGHTAASLTTCGAEVQKGNPPTERKIQRLFRDPAVSGMIKKCNDFGAGGVAVAIGELTDGLEINLDVVPKKYDGLDGTELAISESQERMAVVVAASDEERFIAAARAENLEANRVAVVTDSGRLQMVWRGKPIVNLSREFLNTNGVKQQAKVLVGTPDPGNYLHKVADDVSGDLKTGWMNNLRRLSCCSQKGLVERFDSTIGAGTVLMPFGGRYQLTPAEGMAARLPVLEGETVTGTLMSYGYNPELSKWSPFHGAVYAVVEAVAKIVALGGDHRRIWFSFQEYFERLGQDPKRWGKPFAALLGAYYAQKSLGLASIGGKDSMSGTFEDLTVPPTLVAFAVAVTDVREVLSSEFKQSGSRVVLLPLGRDNRDLPDFDRLHQNFSRVRELAARKKIKAACSVRAGGLAETISKMCFGNKIGFTFTDTVEEQLLFGPGYGSLVLELAGDEPAEELFTGLEYRMLGVTQVAPEIKVNGVRISLDEAISVWEAPLENVFPTRPEVSFMGTPEKYVHTVASRPKSTVKIARPRIFMPVFPGTNCEYDTARVFEKAGGVVDLMVIRNLTPEEIEESTRLMAEKIHQAQIIMLPGGFSGGDEPDGSGKFIATAFRNPYVREAVTRFLKERDGLMLGICNGFQALIKLGLLPYGEIREITAASPTLTFNTLGRHVSCLVRTRVASNLSPWLSHLSPGAVHTVAVSHGEGRFAAAPEVIAALAASGQIATQYVDPDGEPTYDIRYNPNGSAAAIEGITSPDGRIFGKMGHSERYGPHLLQNVPGEKDQGIFAAGVRYFQ